MNEAFFTRKCMVILSGGQKSGRNNEVTVRQGSTVLIKQEIIIVAVSSLLWCKS